MDTKIEGVVREVAERGWTVAERFLPAEGWRQLREDARQLWHEGHFRQAGIGHGQSRQVRPEIRGDYVHWLDPYTLSPALQDYWNRIEALRLAVNEAMYLGVFEFEAHLAVYPPGAFYRRHLDQFREVQYRTISCLLYLNDEEWAAEDGGQLRVYHPPSPNPAELADSPTAHLIAGPGALAIDDAYTDVIPTGNTFVCFRSDLIYHEVLPATRERFSLTGWLRKRQ